MFLIKKKILKKKKHILFQVRVHKIYKQSLPRHQDTKEDQQHPTLGKYRPVPFTFSRFRNTSQALLILNQNNFRHQYKGDDGGQ